MRKSGGIVCAFAVWVLSMGATACTYGFDPVEEAVDEALDLPRFFEASDGTQIELSHYPDGRPQSADVVKVGSSQLELGTLEVGDTYLWGLVPTDTPNEYRSLTYFKSGAIKHATILLGESTLEIIRPAGEEISGQTQWDEISPPGGNDGNDGDGDGTPGDTELLYLKDQEGADDSHTYHSITVPAGTTKLVVEMFEENEWGNNLGDLFLSRGSQPVVNGEEPYRYDADWASINPNRQRETIQVSNPAAGQYWILMYGYHEYYNTSIRATISQ